jgi:hypothetical protein
LSLRLLPPLRCRQTTLPPLFAGWRTAARVRVLAAHTRQQRMRGSYGRSRLLHAQPGCLKRG